MTMTHTWTNPTTGKGWTDAEEATFADIMRIGRMAHMDAIRLYRRCKSDPGKALRVAKRDYEMSDERAAAMERSKAARLAGLAKANQRRAQNRLIERQECPAQGLTATDGEKHRERGLGA